ncbi:hypothetical protein BJ165DRAFT_577044 [Panaeolus papilionaceus]|nr:hypothetical protein BJ165DRAFT_577044 [Panaeolus papilionaceus]
MTLTIFIVAVPQSQHNRYRCLDFHSMYYHVIFAPVASASNSAEDIIWRVCKSEPQVHDPAQLSARVQTRQTVPLPSRTQPHPSTYGHQYCQDFLETSPLGPRSLRTAAIAVSLSSSSSTNMRELGMRGTTGKSITLNPLVLKFGSTPLHTTVLSLLVRTVTPPRQTCINSMPHAPPSRLLALQPPLASSHPRHLRLPTPISEPNTEQIWVASFLLLGNEAGWRRR